MNPFAPGAGRRPPELVGRTAELVAFDTTLARARRRLSSRGMILSGLRGVGKTVLLGRLQEQAAAKGWLVVSLEGERDAGARVEERLVRRLVVAARRYAPPGGRVQMEGALGTIESYKRHVGLTGIALHADPAPGRADSGDLETDLGELVEDVTTALAPDGVGLALFIDEMQDLSKEVLGAMLAVQHAANQQDQFFYLVGAGLPSLPATLTDARSYAERLFDYRTIGKLTPEAAARALTEPIRKLGADFEPDALDLLLQAADGYPYFLQEYGKAVWDVAPEKTFILDDAEAALSEGTARLDEGFFRARWDRASAAERGLLRAMAEDGEGPSSTGGIARRRGKPTGGIGPARAALINKGLIYAPEYGYLAYTVPGMARFIMRQSGE